MKTIPFHRVAAIVAALVLLVSTVSARATTGLPCRYEVAHTIQVPPCIVPSGVNGTGISPNGRWVCGGLSYCDTGFLFIFDTKTGQRQEIAIPAGLNSIVAVDITDDRIIGGYYDRVGVGYRGFVLDLDANQWTEMATAHPQQLGSSFVTGINASGTVCGVRSIGSPESTFHPWTAFIWSPKIGYVDVGLSDGCSTFANDIADDGSVAGSVCGQFGIGELDRGFIYRQGEITILPVIPGGVNSVAVAITRSGQHILAGLEQLDPILSQAYLVREGVSTILPIPVGLNGCAIFRVTDDNLIGGNCHDVKAPEPLVPCVWRGNQVKVVNVPLPPGQYVYQARDMSDDGTFILRVIVSGQPSRCVVAQPVWPYLGDVNCDEQVNVHDLLNVIGSWGPCPECPTDLDENGVTNVVDLIIVLQNWG